MDIKLVRSQMFGSMHKLLSALLLTLFSFGCQNFVPTKNSTEAEAFSSINELPDYYTYLDKVVQLQQQYESSQTEALVFPVQFHVIRPLLDAPLKDENFSPAINYLNRTFESTNIRFEQEYGINYLYSNLNLDTFYHNGNIEKQFTYSTYNLSVINIYIVNSADDVLGFTHYPQVNDQKLFISQDHLLEPSLIHEMGHYFGLLHTFEVDQNTQSIVNCNSGGDKICDTSPDIAGASFSTSDCTLFGNYLDKAGNSFKPDLSNYMSYYDVCRKTFSEEQRKRMYFIAKKIKLPQLRTKA